MKVTVTGATGLIGGRLVRALRDRGDEVTVLSRDPEKARSALGADAVAWDPGAGPAPEAGLSGRDAVVHLAGENVAQRWSDDAKRRIRDSREQGTRNLVAGLRGLAEEARPGALVSSSAVGYYGDRGKQSLDEDTPPGEDFLAQVCVAWEREAQAAGELGVRVVRVRTGVVLDKDGGALGKMLPFFKLGLGGPVAGGGQMLAWVHADDVVGIYLNALDDRNWSGAVNATAPEPVTNKTFSKALGRALHRPAFLPVPAFALQLLYGDMAELVTMSQDARPVRATGLGYRHQQPDLDLALRSALGS
jgi:uncharacterized protein (TIGR01777 family)